MSNLPARVKKKLGELSRRLKPKTYGPKGKVNLQPSPKNVLKCIWEGSTTNG